MKQIYEALKDENLVIRFKWLPKRDYGWIMEVGDKQVISINIFDKIVEIVIHEILHQLNPRWTEKQVLKKEERICRKLTIRQKKYILRIVFKRAVPSAR